MELKIKAWLKQYPGDEKPKIIKSEDFHRYEDEKAAHERYKLTPEALKDHLTACFNEVYGKWSHWSEREEGFIRLEDIQSHPEADRYRNENEYLLVRYCRNLLLYLDDFMKKFVEVNGLKPWCPMDQFLSVLQDCCNDFGKPYFENPSRVYEVVLPHLLSYYREGVSQDDFLPEFWNDGSRSERLIVGQVVLTSNLIVEQIEPSALEDSPNEGEWVLF